MSPLSNARMIGEAWQAYKERRAAGNKAIRIHAKGHLAHVSASIVHLPYAGADAAVDAAVRARQYRRLSVVTTPVGERIRVGCTKGDTYKVSGGRLKGESVSDWKARRAISRRATA